MAKLISPHTIVVVGPPGSGKGTQAARIAELLGWSHIDVGDLLRNAARQNTDTALTIRDTMQRGQMLPAEIVRPIIETAVLNHQEGFVLDGYARRVEQVEILTSWAAAGDIPPIWGIQINVPSADIIERIRQRRYCTGCHHKNYLVNDTDEAVRCLRCGGHLTKRTDDTDQTVKQRLETYERETIPAIKQLKSIARVSVIDGRGSIDEVAQRISDVIKHEPDAR